MAKIEIQRVTNKKELQCECGMPAGSKPFHVTVDGQPKCILCLEMHDAIPELSVCISMNDMVSEKKFHITTLLQRARAERHRLRDKEEHLLRQEARRGR